MLINKEYYFDDSNHIQKNRTKKKQIILLNSGCSLDEHLTKIKTRFNGKYDRLPCFFISQTGEIYQHYNPIYYSLLMEGHQIEKHSITITLENVGWLFKDSLTGKFTNWKGVEYTGELVEVPWRNKKYWATYSNEQYEKLAELIDYLCIQHNIIKEFIGNNIVVNKANNYRGILNRSNYSKNYYDLSPAADFKKLNELIEKEYEHKF